MEDVETGSAPLAAYRLTPKSANDLKEKRMSIAKIERVPLREVWKHEAYDFTQWLEENIEILGEAIDREIANTEREKKTESTFSIDLVLQTGLRSSSRTNWRKAITTIWES